MSVMYMCAGCKTLVAESYVLEELRNDKANERVKCEWCGKKLYCGKYLLGRKKASI